MSAERPDLEAPSVSRPSARLAALEVDLACCLAERERQTLLVSELKLLLRSAGDALRQAEQDQHQACQPLIREAEQARGEADQARAEADQARGEADQARAEAEQARIALQRSAAEIELLRTELVQVRTQFKQAVREAELALVQAEQVQPLRSQLDQAFDRNQRMQERLVEVQAELERWYLRAQGSGQIPLGVLPLEQQEPPQPQELSVHVPDAINDNRARLLATA